MFRFPVTSIYISQVQKCRHENDSSSRHLLHLLLLWPQYSQRQAIHIYILKEFSYNSLNSISKAAGFCLQSVLVHWSEPDSIWWVPFLSLSWNGACSLHIHKRWCSFFRDFILLLQIETDAWILSFQFQLCLLSILSVEKFLSCAKLTDILFTAYQVLTNTK